MNIIHFMQPCMAIWLPVILGISHWVTRELTRHSTGISHSIELKELD